jgi:hypothetical protein
MAKTEVKEKESRLTKADQHYLKALPAEDQKLIEKIEKAYNTYEGQLQDSLEMGTPPPSLPDLVRFCPILKKYEGGVDLILWEGSSKFNGTSGEQEVVPAVTKSIRPDGYVPTSLDEALRLLVLARKPNHLCAITTWDRREMTKDIQTAEARAIKAESELAESKDEIARMKKQIEEMKVKK